MQSDRLLGGFGTVELKILLDIVMENQRAEGFTAAEIGAAPGGFTKQALLQSIFCLLQYNWQK